MFGAEINEVLAELRSERSLARALQLDGMDMHSVARNQEPRSRQMATTTFEKVTDSISHGLHDAGERIVDVKDDAAASSARVSSTLGKLMKKHPLLTIAQWARCGLCPGRDRVVVEEPSRPVAQAGPHHESITREQDDRTKDRRDEPSALVRSVPVHLASHQASDQRTGIPMAMVMMIPPGSRPGITSFASAPTTRPITSM